MLSLGVRPKIVGSFPKSGTFIIMMNHSSFLDVFLFPLIPKGAYTGLTAVENFKYPVFSSLIRRLKAIPIDRKSTLVAIRSIEKAEAVLKEGVHIGILPEGTRTTTGKMRPLKKGGFHMALNTGTSIVPVGICGAFAGIAGVGEVTGPIGLIYRDISPNYGFTAIIVAFLGRLHPIGIIFSSLVIALTYLGAEDAQLFMQVPQAVGFVFQGLVLFYLLGADLLINYRLIFTKKLNL